jgi:pyruvate formate lyase activating enzyme
MKQAVIFDIQRFSIHDGPGIRTTVFLKGCPLRCAWCQNPESLKTLPEIVFYSHRCAGCLKCKPACGEQAILDEPERRIDFNRCTSCGQCVPNCRFDALKIAGTPWDADRLLQEIEKDGDFFQDSGGGITLSGGEPGLHTEFLERFLPLVKAKGIHVNMETCGLFQWEKMTKIIRYLDLVYFDLKIMDPDLHKTYTGQDNKIIFQNFSMLAESFSNLQARMPVIPTINDSRENIIVTARFLKQFQKSSIHLLKYHPLGEAKLRGIQTGQKPMKLEQDAAAHLATAAQWFEKEDIRAIVPD